MHPVLRRQIRRVGILDAHTPPSPEIWAKFLERVTRAYDDADQDRYTLERSLSISSREMQEVYERLNRAKDLAEAAARAKGEFVATMSHELRTPMNGVLGMTDLLLGMDLQPEQRECAMIILNSARSLLSIVDDILDFSKIEAGKLVLEEIEFDVVTVVEDVLAMFAEKAQEKGLELARIVDPSLPERLRGDPARLRQILTNLVGNAVKFTERGEVVVSFESRARDAQSLDVRCEVRDTGPGIEADTLARLFEPFTQADSSTTRRFGGTGLGLSICKRLVEAMGGTIHVASEPGAGSIFVFEVCLRTASAGAPRATLDAAGRTFLVADDHAASRASLARELERLGAVVHETGNAADAIAAAKAFKATGRPFTAAFVDFELSAPDDGDAADELARYATLVRMGPWSARISAVRECSAALFLIKPMRRTQMHGILESLSSSSLASAPLGAHVSASAPAHGSAEGRGAFGFDPEASVLLVEDNAVNQKVARMQIRRLGVRRLDEASNGAEAVELVAGKRYDLVLMDCSMPRMDGFEATRRIREREENGRRTPIVAMTANALSGDRERCLASGMDDYLPKPVAPALLELVLRRWLPAAPALPGDPRPPKRSTA